MVPASRHWKCVMSNCGAARMDIVCDLHERCMARFNILIHAEGDKLIFDILALTCGVGFYMCVFPTCAEMYCFVTVLQRGITCGRCVHVTMYHVHSEANLSQMPSKAHMVMAEDIIVVTVAPLPSTHIHSCRACATRMVTSLFPNICVGRMYSGSPCQCALSVYSCTHTQHPLAISTLSCAHTHGCRTTPR